MKLNLLFIGCLILNIGAHASDAIDIQRYSQNGDLTARIMGQMMPDQFFVSPRQAAITNGKNYVSKVQIPRQVLTDEVDLGRGQVMITTNQNTSYFQLILANDDLDDQDLVISAESIFGGVQNFLLRVKAGQELVLDMSSLRDASHFFVISSRELLGWLNHNDDLTELSWDVPEEDTYDAYKMVSYCNDTGRWKRLKSTADGGEVIAYFERWHSSYTPTTTPYSVYSMAIHWPNIGDVFHGPYGTSLDPGNGPACKMIDYRTINANGLTNWWRGNIEDAIMFYSTEAYGCIINGSCTESTADWLVLKYPNF